MRISAEGTVLNGDIDNRVGQFSSGAGRVTVTIVLETFISAMVLVGTGFKRNAYVLIWISDRYNPG